MTDVRQTVVRQTVGWDGLLEALPAGPRCSSCHGPVPAGHDRCACCLQAQRLFGPGVVDAVAPVALARMGGPLAGALWRYKAGPVAARAQLSSLLAGLLGEWLQRHLACVAAACAVTNFDLTVTVPSRSSSSGAAGSGPGGGGFGRVVGLAGVDAAAPFVVMARGRDRWALRLEVAARWRSRVQGRTVLVLDDTWTTGSTVQAASAALKAAGAAKVGAVVLGLHLAPGYPGAVPYLARVQPFERRACCLCHGPRNGAAGC
jgi:predicted amidophosphoribosyltransferase